MGKEFYIRTVTAGRHVTVVRYTRTLPKDSPAVRREKQAATNKAQRYINCKNAAEKLEAMLYTNFDRKDACFVTLTFDDQHIPATIQATKKAVAGFLGDMRKEWAADGRELKYIYTVEGQPDGVAGIRQWEIAPWKEADRWEALSVAAVETQEEGTRFHAHCFLLLDKSDHEAVRRLWGRGQVYISRIKVNEPFTFERLASYVTKEYRGGSQPANARSYVPSLNLDRPTVEGHWCNAHETIALPQGAELLHSGQEETVYASYQYLKYRMPRVTAPPKAYVSRGKLPCHRRP